MKTTQRAGQPQPSSKKLIRKWVKQKWEERWDHCLDSIAENPAHGHELGYPRDKLHQGFRIAESSLVVQLRTEKAGFAAFLHARRVSDMISPACQGGWRRQDPKHVIIFCPNHARNRRSLYEAAGTDRYQGTMSTGKGLRAVARWARSEGLLLQFSLAKVQIDRVEGRVLNDGDNEDEAEAEAPEQD